MISLSLSDRVAIVTGGSRGIGRAAAECFARAGANVMINYHSNKSAAEEAVKSCEEVGVEAIAAQADVSMPGDAQRLIDAAIQNFKRVDFLVCNAGFSTPHSINKGAHCF